MKNDNSKIILPHELNYNDLDGGDKALVDKATPDVRR